ncbi:MAG: ferrous iron transport protein A [Gammaproteobacteria bacterium]|nr:ferrous iron transport protein A [Gammaproteobacteria bacterium]MYF58124.1 ferrous iron transport protein A [Gammaproteobacteria bacterium]MYH32183.1 ferrous iron transport protein A [Gammaproteobacteria bacterium]MYL00648.1 ferrous iron transport protein A [Gammaproteobacteria bacterium]
MLDSQHALSRKQITLAREIGLDELPNGCGSVIRTVQGEGRVSRELLTLGLVPGVRVRVLRRGIGGDPLEIVAGGHPVCLRRDQSRMIRVLAATDES